MSAESVKFALFDYVGYLLTVYLATISNSDYIAFIGRMLMNYEFGRMWKEVVVA
jgi:hypothetical protein